MKTIKTKVLAAFFIPVTFVNYTNNDKKFYKTINEVKVAFKKIKVGHQLIQNIY